MPPRVLEDLAATDDDRAIDVRQVAWATPALMVGLAAVAHRHIDVGQNFAVLGPQDENVAGYLARMRLGRVLSDLGVDHDLPTDIRARDRSNDLLEVRAVTTEDEANTLARLVHRNVGRSDRDLADALFNSLAEVGDNVADHSGATGYMAAQKIPSRNELHIAVADGGVGLLHWLGPILGAEDDSAALDLALAGRSRYTDEADRGGGIVRAVELVVGMSGTAMLASGTAWATSNARRRTRGTCRRPYRGALFEAHIPLGEGRDVSP